MGQPHHPRHLRAGRGHIGRDVILLHQILPAAVGMETAGGKMSVHCPTARHRFRVELGMGVELSEKLLNRSHTQGEHYCLVAVVTGSKVAGLPGVCHGNLGYLFAAAKDAKLGLSAQDFPPPDQAGMSALQRQPVIGQDLLPRQVRPFNFNHFFFLRHGSPVAQVGSGCCIFSWLLDSVAAWPPGQVAGLLNGTRTFPLLQMLQKRNSFPGADGKLSGTGWLTPEPTIQAV